MPSDIIRGDSSALSTTRIAVTTETYGHSFATGQGVTSAQRASGLLAASLGAREINRGISGTELTNDVYNAHYGNGWSQRHLFRKSSLSLPQVIIDWQGLNDIAKYGAGAAALNAYKYSLRGVLRYYRQVARAVDTSASVAYGGTGWTAFNDPGGWTWHYTATNGTTITITTPANFPGGSLDLIFASLSNCGGIWTASVDGGAGTALDTRPGAFTANDAVPVVKQLTGLTPGAHTIVLTSSAITFRTAFWGWAIPAQRPPIVLVPLVNYPYNATYYATVGDGSGRTDPSHADIDALNAAITSVIAEFDKYVIGVDTESLFLTNPANFQADGLHPNVAGHALVATALGAKVATITQSEIDTAYSELNEWRSVTTL